MPSVTANILDTHPLYIWESQIEEMIKIKMTGMVESVRLGLVDGVERGSSEKEEYKLQVLEKLSSDVTHRNLPKPISLTGVK